MWTKFKQEEEEEEERNKRRLLSALVSPVSLLISCLLLTHRAANYPRLPPNSPSNHLISHRFLITQPGMQLQFFISILSMAEIIVRNKIRHLNKWITWEALYGTGLQNLNAHWERETVQCVYNAALAKVRLGLKDSRFSPPRPLFSRSPPNQVMSPNPLSSGLVNLTTPIPHSHTSVHAVGGWRVGQF